MSEQDDTSLEANMTREEAWQDFARCLPALYDPILPDLKRLYLVILNSLVSKVERQHHAR